MTMTKPTADVMPPVMAEMSFVTKAPAEVFVPSVVTEMPVQMRAVVVTDATAEFLFAVVKAVVVPTGIPSVVGASETAVIAASVGAVFGVMPIESVSPSIAASIMDLAWVHVSVVRSFDDNVKGAAGRADDKTGARCVRVGLHLGAHQKHAETGY